MDTSDLDAVRAAIRPNTKLIHIETPGNPTLKISDIKAIAEIAHENGALLSVDNTFASPFNQRPIKLGADFTVESLTKYINGHGDAIIGKTKYLDVIRVQSQVNLGATISPFNAWLIMRGSVTLPLRMRQHNENALVSLGYDASLIVFLGENDERQYLYPEEFHNVFFRFSVGIEDAEDIIGDLKQALEKVDLL